LPRRLQGSGIGLFHKLRWGGLIDRTDANKSKELLTKKKLPASNQMNFIRFFSVTRPPTPVSTPEMRLS
jgi:hypothetical protein